MWTQVCDIQETLTPNALPSNISILFSLLQVSTEENPKYLRKIQNFISKCKLGGQDFSTPMVNIIAVQHLDPVRHQQVLFGYKFVPLDLSYKYLDALETYLALIEQNQGLTNITPATVDLEIVSVSNHRKQTSTPHTRGKQDSYFSLSKNCSGSVLL